ncbi:MAG: DUF2783 domain-containing protein [Leadbetterella sp.]|nr:DUF2783 domain-containing protein [Leadbetterella sp.]
MFLNKGIYNGKRLLSRLTVDVILANHIGDMDVLAEALAAAREDV